MKHLLRAFTGKMVRQNIMQASKVETVLYSSRRNLSRSRTSSLRKVDRINRIANGTALVDYPKADKREKNRRA